MQIESNFLRPKWLGHLFSGLALVSSFSTSAAIEYATFTDSDGKTKTTNLYEGQTSILNPTSEISIAVSAGLDRKLKATVSADGQVLGTKESTVITINDVLQADKAFYGKLMTLPVSGDGLYEITVETLSLLGDVVNTERYQFTKDGTPPSMGQMRLSSYGGSSNALTPSNVWHTGYYTHNFVELPDITDNSGIRDVNLVSYDLSSGEPAIYKKRVLKFDSDKNLSRFTFSEDSGFWPKGDNADTLYGVAFEVVDNAGNVATSEIQSMYYDTVGAVGLKLIGVRDPNSTNSIAGLVGYESYTKGMTVHENPISFIYSIPKNEYIAFRRGGYGPVGQSKVITDHDDENVYVVFDRTFGFTNSNYVGFRDQRSWRVANVSYDLKLSEDVPKAPVRVSGAEYLYSDIGWSSWNRWRIQVEQLPIQILASRQRVEPRPYVQVWNHHGMSCRIDPGEDICEAYLTTPWELVDGGAAYYHGSSSINSEDNRLVGPPSWADVTYNAQYPPEITGYHLSDDFELTVNVTQPNAGWWFDNLRLKDVYLTNSTGEKLPLTRSLIRAGISYEAKWDLSQLPEGTHDISIVAIENHGLKDLEENAVQFKNDTTPPVISVGYADQGTVPDTINDLRNLVITVEDTFSEVFIDSIELKTQDSELDVLLGYSLLNSADELTSKTFSPELPRLFPSLVEGKKYDLRIRVRDQYGNVSSKSLTFSYMPDNLVVMSTQRGLNTSEMLSNANDEALNYLESNIELKLDDGRMATGYQEAIITLNPSSDFPLEILGQNLHPGESKAISIDLGLSGGRLKVPLVPLSEGVSGSTSLMFEIPSLSTIYNDREGWQQIFNSEGGCQKVDGCETSVPYGEFSETKLEKLMPTSLKCSDGTLPNTNNQCTRTYYTSASQRSACPTGSEQVNGKCYQSRTSLSLSKHCPAGTRYLEEGTCNALFEKVGEDIGFSEYICTGLPHKVSMISLSGTHTNYYCSSLPSLTVPAKCASGETLDNGSLTCLSGQISMVTENYCNSGTLTGTQCRRTSTSAPTVEYCPEGGLPLNSKCESETISSHSPRSGIQTAPKLTTRMLVR